MITGWIKSQRSNTTGQCVEMRQNGSERQVQDSKRPGQGVLTLKPEAFSAWVAAAKAGELDKLS